jgi:tetratricopeptide (TPR) repeat protein
MFDPSWRRGAAVVALVLAVGCAKPRPQPPAVGDIPVQKGAGEATAVQRTELEKAYADLKLGKTSAAEQRFRKLRQQAPKLTAALTGLAYVYARTGRYADAERMFGEVLAARPGDLDALLGLGDAAARQGDLARAVQNYRMASQMHAADATARKRLADAKLLFTEKGLAAARAANTAGDQAGAEKEYRRTIEIVPELGGLRLELAELLVKSGATEGAVALLEADPVADPQVQARLGELRLQLGRYEAAVEAYQKAIESDPANTDLHVRYAQAKQALDFSRMPEEYQRIFTAPFITRADLAALINVKVTALARVSQSDPKVAVDISGSWAKDHILKTLALDIIDVYPNHTFQPAAMIRRGDLARAVARVLDLLSIPKPQPAARITDMTPSHLYYAAAMRVVGAGLMDLSPEGAFEPGQRVSGQEAAVVVEALSRLLGP